MDNIKTKCPVCHYEDKTNRNRCKKCGWKISDDMNYYTKKGFLVENNEIILESDDKNIIKKRLLAPMSLNKIYAIFNIIIYIPLLLLGLLLWAFDGFSGNPIIGTLWSILYGGIALLNILKGILLLKRTKFGFIFNRVINSFYLGIFGAFSIFSVLSDCGFLTFGLLILIIFSIRLWIKSKKKIYLILMIVLSLISLIPISINLSVVTFGTVCIFLIEYFLLKYYKKHKDIFLGIIKREDISTMENELETQNV